MNQITKRQYTLRDVKNFLIDSLGYSEEDCKDMNFDEMLFIINDNDYLKDFQDYTS